MDGVGRQGLLVQHGRQPGGDPAGVVCVYMHAFACDLRVLTKSTQCECMGNSRSNKRVCSGKLSGMSKKEREGTEPVDPLWILVVPAPVHLEIPWSRSADTARAKLEKQGIALATGQACVELGQELRGRGHRVGQ